MVVAMAGQWQLILTASVSTLATVVLVWSTVNFHRWNKKQRRPDPILVDTHYRLNENADGIIITLEFANPGDVPIPIEFPPLLSILNKRQLSYKIREVPIRQLPPRQLTYIPIEIKKEEFQVTASSARPHWNDIAMKLTYISGSKRRVRDFGIVARVAFYSHGPVTWLGYQNLALHARFACVAKVKHYWKSFCSLCHQTLHLRKIQ